MRTLTKWSVADYHKMRAQGLLDHRRCELIHREIWEMAPKGEFHHFINDRGAEYLKRILRDQAKIFEAHPITLSESEPQPAIAIVQPPDTRYLKHHPYPEDIFWLIEVADTTLSYDLDIKQKLYAEAGIQEYWVIDVPGPQIVVLKDLQSSKFSYQNTLTHGMIYPMAFPDIAIEVHRLVSIPEE